MIKLKYYMYTTREAHTVIPPHYHDYYELVYYFSGGGKIRFNPAEISATEKQAQREAFLVPSNEDLSGVGEARFKPLQYALFRPRTVHNEIHGDKKGELLTVGFSMDDNIRLEEGLFTDRNMEIRKIVDSIREEYENRRSNYKTALNAYAALLVSKLSRLSCASSEATDALELAKTYIDNYYMTGIGVEELAVMSHYSVDHFRKLFHERFGISPKSYINEKRMERATDLLIKSDIPLSEIPEKIGFCDSSQFSVFYKKMTGETPKSVRRKRQLGYMTPSQINDE